MGNQIKLRKKQKEKKLYKFRILIKKKKKKIMNIEDVIISKPKQIRKFREAQLDEDQMNQNSSQKQSQNQEFPIKIQSFLNVFKNNQMIKKKSIVSTFFPNKTGSDKKLTHHFKITPVTLINKIQECRPYHQYSVVHKQLGFDVMLQTDKTSYKMKNCISSVRSNSEIYKRLSKNFFENLKNGIDQCILFTGSQSGARTQSSIGNQNNPGIFMIVAIAVLDQKYKQNHEMFDAEFSFLEYRGEKMFDLLNYTKLPLEPKFRQNLANVQKSINVQFCQHRVKVCTFLQFIRLFKIALFNNKERDIRTNKQPQDKNQPNEKSQQLASTFIMKIRVKKYSDQNKLIFEQQSILIDLDQNCYLRSNGQNKQQSSQLFAKQKVQNIKRSSDVGSRSLLDFILIEINNSNPLNRPIHYHMVEKNLLLEVLRKYLRQKQPLKSQSTIKNLTKNIISSFTEKQEPKQYFVGGSLFIIHSFTANPLNYQQNIRFYESLTSALGQDWLAIYKTKNFFKKLFDLQFFGNSLNNVIDSIKSRKYASLKDLNYSKQFYVKQSKKIISDIEANRNIILECFNHRKNLTYNRNVFIAYQLQLIGNCIKSDNFKDFYTSKSYLALPRQIHIKTQKIKAQIIDGTKNLKQTEEKYDALKKKQYQEKKYTIVPDLSKNSFNTSEKLKYTTSNLPNFSEAIQSKTKFKMLQKSQNIAETNESVDYQNFIALKKQIYDYFHEVWYRAFLTDERIITQQLILEDLFVQQTWSLKEKLRSFIKQVQSIQETFIRFIDDDRLADLDNLTKLLKSTGKSKKRTVKKDFRNSGILPFHVSKSSFNLKKENIMQKTTNFPRIQQSQSQIKKREKQMSTKSTKNKDNKKIEVFQIKVKVNFCNLILNPNKLV